MDQYEKLRRILDKHLAGAPPSKKFDQILRILFTPEEVRVALAMLFTPRQSMRLQQKPAPL